MEESDIIYKKVEKNHRRDIMKGLKFLIVILLITFLMGCSNEANGDQEYESMVDTIKNIEMSNNQLNNLKISFEEYKPAFEGKFITEDLEKRYIGEDQGFLPLDKKIVLKGEVKKENLEELQEQKKTRQDVMVVEMDVDLKEMQFSKFYEADGGDKGRIYVKEIYEYAQDGTTGETMEEDIKGFILGKIYTFKKVEDDWKIMIINEKSLGQIKENKEREKEEIITLYKYMHDKKEVEFIKTIEIEE